MPDLYYNQENGRLEKRSTLVHAAEAQKASEEDLLNKALDRLNKGLLGNLLADDDEADLMI